MIQVDRTTITRFALLAPSVVLTVALMGCAAGNDGSTAPVNSQSPEASPSADASQPAGSAPPTETSPSAATSASPGPDSAPTPAPSAIQGTPISLEIEGQQITGVLDDNATAASLSALLPLTLSFRDFGGQEKLAALPSPLSLDGAPERSGADPLTIGYYSPDQALILYYDQVGAFAGIVPIGTFDDLAAVQGQTGDFTLTIRRAN